MNKLMLKRNEIIRKRNGKKGFTLIELIVVIAILAIIAALALPAFNGLMDDANKRVAESNARSVYTAAKAAYSLDSKGSDLEERTKTMLGDDFTGKIGVSVSTTGTLTITTTWEEAVEEGKDKKNKYTGTCVNGKTSSK